AAPATRTRCRWPRRSRSPCRDLYHGPAGCRPGVSTIRLLYNRRTMLKHNSYFEGQVQSIGFERLGRRMTAGVIAPGEYHFGTEAPERMTVVSGELFARLAVGGEWRGYPAG